MAKANIQEERLLIKLVEKLPFPEEEKTDWVTRIHNGEMSEELAGEIRQKISAPAENEDERTHGERTRYLAELTMLVKRWRLAYQSHNFGRGK